MSHHSTLPSPALQGPEELQWREIAPKHWTRRLDAIEQYFHAAAASVTPSGIVHAMVSVGATLSPSLAYSIEDVRAAWKSLRYEHPRIACSISDGCLHYTVPSEPEAQQWLAESLIIDNSGATALEILGTLRSSKMGVLVLVPERRELFFQISHDHIDGVGATAFLDHLIGAIAEPKHVTFGNEYQHLSSSVTQVLDIRAPNKDDIQIARNMVADLAGGLPGLTLRQTKSLTPTFAVRMKRMEFSSAQTCDIRRQARYRGITVTHACHSSMIQALDNLAISDVAAHASLFFINLRHSLPTEADQLHSPVSVHLTAIPAVLRASCWKDFLHLAHHLKDSYTQSNVVDSVRLHKPLYEGLVSAVAAAGGGQTFFSSLGIVDQRNTHQLDDFWIGAGSATADATMYVWTFHGRLTVAVWYNEAFYETEVVTTFLREMCRILLAGLDIGKSD